MRLPSRKMMTIHHTHHVVHETKQPLQNTQSFDMKSVIHSLASSSPTNNGPTFPKILPVFKKKKTRWRRLTRRSCTMFVRGGVLNTLFVTFFPTKKKIYRVNFHYR
jgi:hypothetical protein